MTRSAALALGTEVLGADGQPIGAVKAIEADYILIDRPWRRDVYIPIEAIQTMRHNYLVLALPATAVDSMDWPRPPLL